jgi:hypothetical protein
MCGGVVGYFCLNFLHKVEGKYTKGGKLALCKCYDLMGMSKPTCMYVQYKKVSCDFWRKFDRQKQML